MTRHSHWRALVPAALLALMAPGLARAECDKPEILGPAGSSLGLYSADGKFTDEVPASELAAPAAALDCNESLGLVLVRLNSRPEPVWVDRVELRLKLTVASSQDVCVVDAGTRATDHRDAVVAGIGDEAKARNCAPAPR